MAKEDSITMLTYPVAGQVLRIHLASWRYLAVLTLPPAIFALSLTQGISAVILLSLVLITHYYCWRLWLDERLFRVLYDADPQVKIFDNAMHSLWGGRRSDHHTIESRWQGARTLLQRAMLSTALLWLALLCIVFFYHSALENFFNVLHK